MNKLYVAMMGLPARGKSTLARRIKDGLGEMGLRSRVFNNGELRRKVLGADTAFPEFFNPANECARQERERLAMRNMEEARIWLHNEGDVAIVDATHGTMPQRNLLREMLGDHPVLFIECVNEDPLLLDMSMRRKAHLPEFAAMSEEEALASFRKRVAYYESVYTPLSHNESGCWMLVDSVDKRILDEAPGNDIPSYAAIRDIIITRWVANLYLVRHAETSYNLENRIGGNSPLTARGLEQSEKLADCFTDKNLPWIFTSTLIRSKMMSEPLIARKAGCNVLALKEFDEINPGICDNMRYSEVRRKMPEVHAARAADKYNYAYPGGESYADLRERVGTGLRRAIFLAQDDTLMIIAHQAVNRVILSHLLFCREEDVPYLYIPQDKYYHISITQRHKLFEMLDYI